MQAISSQAVVRTGPLSSTAACRKPAASRGLALRVAAINKTSDTSDNVMKMRSVAGAALAVVGLTLFANVPAHAGDLQQQQSQQVQAKQADKDKALKERAETGKGPDITQGVANDNINKDTFK